VRLGPALYSDGRVDEEGRGEREYDSTILLPKGRIKGNIRATFGFENR
jgi:hypothetical protein